MTAEASEPRWRRLGPDERRSDILAAAIKAFGEQPYDAVQMADLARRAGVARTLVHHYFGTKRDLYLEVVRAMMFVPPLGERVRAEGDRHDRIEAIVGWLMDVVEKHGRGWLAMAGSGAGDPEVQALLDEADDLAAERVLDFLGHVATPAQREAAHAAIRAFGGMAKAMSRELIERRSLSGRQARQLLSVALEAILDDLEPPSR
ncbi:MULTISPECIES: TetR/AcrR family transcriptional regulator [Nocardioides]|uniref:TetR/AcrR family transcriptional regulator n=1 Tax=Nocardioides vastitatis TaxID=2568655 RepID=A0ABW0ZKB6_9ACTN|nr:TetR/AcrR family transcriptional regulator [Nocardioides sp.]